MPPKKRRTTKGKELKGRPRRKKVSALVKEGIEYVDYKDVNLIRSFMSERAKIRARRVTGNNVQQQREVARAVKNAREMALIPYTNRVVTQRKGGGKRRRDGGRDGGREERGPRSSEEAPATEAPAGEAPAEVASVEVGE